MALIGRGAAALAVMVLCAAGHGQERLLKLPDASTTTESAQERDEGNEVLAWRGTDLATLKWYASVELGPEASAEEIVSKGTPTTPTAQIRTTTGTAATLFTIIEVPAAAPSGAVVTMADIDGEDITYFNGVKIGETSATGVTDFGVPRVYAVDKAIVRQGRNTLAVRLRGIGGSGAFGIRREPLTFGFVPTPPEEHSFVSPAPTRGVTAISEDEARAAIAALDPSTSGGRPVLRKRSSFGRFGEFFHDGLPAVAEVSPTHVANRSAPRFDVVLDRVGAVSLAAEDGEPGIDGWHKLARVDGAARGKAIRYTALSHVMYPGASFLLEEGGYLPFRISFAGGTGVLHVLDEPSAEAALPGVVKAGVSFFAVFEPKAGAVPAVVAVEGGAGNATQAGTQIDLTVTPLSPGKPVRVNIFFPAGLRQVDLSGKPPTLVALAKAVEPEAETTDTLRQWLRVGLGVPEAVDEYFQVRPDAGVVRVYQLARFHHPEGLEGFRPLVTLPPQLTFARRNLRYPVDLPPTTSTGVLAFSGVVPCVDETTGTPPAPDSKGLYAVSYDLPIPPMEERGLLALGDRGGLVGLLNECLTDLPTTSTLNGVDAFYKSRTQGYQALSYLSAENARRLAENSATIVPAALADSRWYAGVEPLSGLDYGWTYYIEGPYFARYDQDWGNGLSLYGLATFAKYAGEWQLVARNWDKVERMFSWFAASDDWEWMRASNGEHGHGTGAGDCMSATYVAGLSYAKLAKNTGRNDEHDYGVYTAARAALLLLNRFVYNDFADRNGLKPPDSMVLGFHEGRGFLTGELDRYPWNATSNISGNGVQPEAFDLYEKHAAEAVKAYAAAFDKAYPKWADGKFVYPFPTIYRNNSGYITLPHIYLRARMEEATADALAAMIESAKSNRYLWWLAPPVLAEVLNERSEAYVADWGRCAFVSARAEQAGERRKVVVVVENKYPPDEVVVVAPRQPLAIEINDGPVPLTDMRYEEGRQWLRVRRPGTNTIEMLF